jgi:hypothetical protein
MKKFLILTTPTVLTPKLNSKRGDYENLLESRKRKRPRSNERRS